MQVRKSSKLHHDTDKTFKNLAAFRMTIDMFRRTKFIDTQLLFNIHEHSLDYGHVSYSPDKNFGPWLDRQVSCSKGVGRHLRDSGQLRLIVPVVYYRREQINFLVLVLFLFIVQ